VREFVRSELGRIDLVQAHRAGLHVPVERDAEILRATSQSADALFEKKHL